MSVTLLSKAQSLASDLSCLDDVFHLIDRRREERDRIAAIYRGGLLKSYSDGRVSCECEVSIDRGAHKWNFVFRAIKDGIQTDQFVGTGPSAMVKHDLSAGDCDRNQVRVCRIAQLIQGPEIVIPSFVGFEPAKDHDNGIGHILTDFSPGNQVIEIIETIGDRELSPSESSIARELRGGVGTLVESGTGRLKDFDGQVCPTIRERRGELEFVGLGAAIRLIRLTEESGCMFVTVLPDCRVQFGNLLFRAL